MKTYLISLLAILLFYQAVSQSRHFVVLMDDNIEIPIYDKPIGNNIKYRIMQDTINELFFAVEILDNSQLRYKVNITSVISSTPGPEIIGWIDKSRCGVFKRWYYDEHNNRYMKLHSAPDEKSSYKIIYEDPNVFDQSIMTAVDYADGDWKKVLFFHDGTLHEGWINKYCDSVYNSST